MFSNCIRPLWDFLTHPKGNVKIILKRKAKNLGIVRALATDSLKESVSLYLRKKREKITKTSHSRNPTFNLVHWVSTVFPNA
jgi:hypothetical protein